ASGGDISIDHREGALIGDSRASSKTSERRGAGEIGTDRRKVGAGGEIPRIGDEARDKGITGQVLCGIGNFCGVLRGGGEICAGSESSDVGLRIVGDGSGHGSAVYSCDRESECAWCGNGQRIHGCAERGVYGFVEGDTGGGIRGTGKRYGRSCCVWSSSGRETPRVGSHTRAEGIAAKVFGRNSDFRGELGTG